MVAPDRSFFCSELLAKAYKVCKVMEDTTEPCSNFMPDKFTEAGFDLPLLAGIEIGPELTFIDD